MENKFHLCQQLLSKIKTKRSEIRERDFIARILKSNELEKAYQFRYKVFCEELKWLPINKEKKEMDRYDRCSIHFGVFDKKNKLIGYGRFILSKNNFMLEKEFKELVPNHIIIKKNAVEVSRVAIDNSLRNMSNFKNNYNTPFLLLLKIMYQWSVKNKIRYWYITIKPDFLKSLQKLFPWKQIGKIKYYQPKVATTAAMLDLKEAENFVFRNNRKLFEWFTK